MDVSIIGGGPGGAYAALLLKKTNPDWSVDVYERYPPATTYGWAIVLPEKIYSTLRDADNRTCEQLLDVTVRWDPIDSVHRGELVRCGGHPYTSVMRNDLLEILQNRCRELGVNLHFETDANPIDVAATADLVIGADGIGSKTRVAFEEQFEPSYIERDDMYAWFGTDHSFEALTHIYEENDDGLWHGAAYPARSVSTFAISTDPKTWENAGMEDSTEHAYIAYLEDLFADYLGGHGLRSKEDKWRQFLTVQNERWHHEHVVLLGDAAHTAHFTIGSGTRMAMEDAITLAKELNRFPNDMQAAFESYEGERMPHVKALQRAADLSVMHFENLPRFFHVDPEQLAYLYLTRTGSNSHQALRNRDPSFVDRIDRWFAERSGGDPDTDPVDQQFEIRDVTFDNRMVSAIEPNDTARDGVPTNAQIERVVNRSNQEMAMIMAEPFAVSATGRISPGTPGLYEDAHRSVWTEAVKRIHEHDALAGVTLVHAGRKGAAKPKSYPELRPLPADAAWELLAPSPVPYGDGWPTPKAMNKGELDRVRKQFVQAARRADAAGFDLISVHAGHGYLLGSFLSPLVNRRTDEYGGNLTHRLSYPTSVVKAVRDVWPESKPLGVTLQATDWVDGGLEIGDASTAGTAFGEAGCDIASVVAGGTVPEENPVTDPNWHRLYSHWIRNETEIPTISTTHVTSLDEVNTMIAGGRADLCYVFDSS